MTTSLCNALNLQYPIVQAPMAGVSTPQMAAAVTAAGGLGSISVGASTPAQAEKMIAETRALSAGPFNVNVFCHQPVVRNEALESAWIERFNPLFQRYQVALPSGLTEIYQTFHQNEPMLAVLEKMRPAVVSFHFGIPPAEAIGRLKQCGIVTLATATSIYEAQEIADNGIDFIVAQGIEAGGHRGIFHPEENDQQLSTFTLLQAIRKVIDLPVIAAGGVMDGAGIAAMLTLGAAGVQLGTAFVLCPESAANAAYRAALKSEAASRTMMTSAISGRPARCIANAFCAHGEQIARHEVPVYPLTYSLGKAVAAAARAQGEYGYDAQWAGQGAHLAREMPAAELVRRLVAEWQQAAGGVTPVA
ncbi:2-nitropropane dioxygenase [Izhakiella australiensis]|uniref:Nitronate monooxygenase n=1 Tax=Izhakiella australiensis TaxID=1926881 RepID=A0A1S8YQL1_9GAMM|nr:nitronate monooxygenase [Izhakiella australiensis]OON41370.1 2-nitropropane dioxygenase [Izhakiella australiensis]